MIYLLFDYLFSEKLCFQYDLLIVLLILFNFLFYFTKKIGKHNPVASSRCSLLFKIIDFGYLFIMLLQNLLNIVLDLVNSFQALLILYIFNMLLALLHFSHLSL